MIKKGLIVGLFVLQFAIFASAQTVITPTASPEPTATESFHALGASRADVAKHFGYPVYGKVISKEVDIGIFHVKGGTIHVLFIKDVAQQLDYHKYGFLDVAFSEREIEAIAAHVGGLKWYKSEKMENTWINEDGSIGMYYGSDPDSDYKHTLSFISRACLEYLTSHHGTPKSTPTPSQPMIKI